MISCSGLVGADDLAEERPDDIGSPAVGEQLCHPVVGGGPGRLQHRGLVEHQTTHPGGLQRGPERAQGAVGVGQHVDGAADGVHHRGDVSGLALNRVVRRVTAGTPTSPVDGVDGRVRLEQGQHRPPARVVRRGPVDEEQRRSRPAAPEADPRAVGGSRRQDRRLRGAGLGSRGRHSVHRLLSRSGAMAGR
jgi:hypothetical protein